MSTLNEVLASAPLFRGLSEASRGVLARVMQSKSLATGQVLYRQGQTGDAMAVVVRGGFLVTSREPDGRELELAHITPGSVVGEMACLDPAPRSATVTAVEASTVALLDRTSFRGLKTGAPAVAVGLMDGLAGVLTTRLRETHARLEASKAALSAGATPGPAPGAPASPAAPPARRPPTAVGSPYRGPLDLKQLRPLQGFTSIELTRLAGVAPPTLFRGGEFLCREGDPGDACFLLARGRLDVLRVRESSEQLLATLVPGALVGQLALLEDAPRSASVRANGDAVVLRLSRTDFRRLLRTHDLLALKLHEVVTIAGVHQVRLANGHITSLLARPRTVPSVSPPPAPVSPSALSMPRTELRPRAAARLLPDTAPIRTDEYLEAAIGEWGIDLEGPAAPAAVDVDSRSPAR